VTAVVVPKGKIDEETIKDYCRGKMARFKVPKKVIFIKDEEMPRTPTGKILHRILRKRYTTEES
jgi:acyl-CoA synthetase (AMP-forming)/AMP-acid ligase II